MNDRPTAEELLAIARTTLREVITPALPADLRYTAAMIGNAMAIAARRIAADETAAAEDELAALVTIYGTVATPADIVRDIRAGRFDGASSERAALLRYLRLLARRRVAETNPKVLGSGGRGGAGVTER